MDKYISYVNPRTNIKGFLIMILVLGVLGLGVGAALVANPVVDELENQEEVIESGLSSPHSLVYGFWSGEKSEIRVFNLLSGENQSIATLPLNIKHVRVLSPEEIIYINDTDESDYGSNIVIKNISNGTERIVIGASADVRIDDYRVSPSGQYIATWEVAKSPASNQLYGGISRVYTAEVNNNSVKNQIYSEVATSPVHYPIAITDNGRVFMDTFLPNDGAGWAYGMSVSDFNGANKQDLGAMKNGTYGSQPVASPDGSKLVFTGYNGAKGEGEELIDGLRRAVLSANTIDVLDTNTLERSTLLNLPTQNLYTGARWDEVTGNVLFSSASKNIEEAGSFSYNIPTSLFQKIESDIDPESDKVEPIRLISVIEDGILLVGKLTTNEETIGNLGSNYDQMLDSVYVININENDVIRLNITGGLVQPIALRPSGYYGLQLFSDNKQAGLEDEQNDQLQLEMFTIKPTLGPKRERQQSEVPPAHQVNPVDCQNWALRACAEIFGFDSIDEWFMSPYNPGQTPDGVYTSDQLLGAKCYEEQLIAGTEIGCYDSPLYLYGEKGTKVNIKVGTPISNPNAYYDPEDGFMATLSRDGFEINGEMLRSLEFDYEPAYHSNPPTKGVIVDRKNIVEELAAYSKNLSLNEAETSDLIEYVYAHTTADKFFISHFSNEISKKILPLYFTPEPDSYTNIVFYIDEKPNLNMSYDLPDFEKIRRNGFTAVEISFFVED